MYAFYVLVVRKGQIFAKQYDFCPNSFKNQQKAFENRKPVLGCLKGTKNTLMIYKEKEEKIVERIIGYADADWGQEKTARKCGSGYLFMFSGAAISRRRKRNQ